MWDRRPVAVRSWFLERDYSTTLARRTDKKDARASKTKENQRTSRANQGKQMNTKEILRSPGDPQPAECVLNCVVPL